MVSSTYRVVPAVDKAARLLDELRGGEALGISELARRISASKGTVRDILLTMTMHGLIVRDGDGRFRQDAGPDLAALAEPCLRSLMSEFGETAILGIIAEDKLEIAARAEPATDLHMTAPIGRRIPLDAGAHGKVLFGEQPIGYDDEELFRGVRAVAAPVTDRSARPIAVLMVVGFKEKLDLRRLKKVGEAVAQAARVLSDRLNQRSAPRA